MGERRCFMKRRLILVAVLTLTLVVSFIPFVQAEEKSLSDWLQIGGEYRFRFDYLKGTVHEHFNFSNFENAAYQQFQAAAMQGLVTTFSTPRGTYLGVDDGNFDPNAIQQAGLVDKHDVKNESLFTNRFRLTLKAKATEYITVKARFAMYKVWGHQTSEPITGGGYFADRITPDGAPFDGTVGHIPQDNKLVVDYGYATWSNIADLPIWFSIGRRPSTEGVPTNIRMNREKVGTSGVPGLMIDYAFDGLTIGVAPYIEALEGFYAKICYGKGYDSGYETDLPGDNTPEDVNFVGLNIVPLDTDTVHIELQWDRAFDIFDTFPDSGVKANLGDIDQYGITAMFKFEDLGPGDLNLFGSAALSKTHPSDEALRMDVLQLMDVDGDTQPELVYVPNAPLAGLLYNYDQNGNPVGKESHTGHAFYVGARYDIKSTGTKIGAEFNYGSKYWIAFAPAGDDIWTSKLGTRGKVYEAYLIQEIKDTPISPNGKAFFRLGYQYYDFDYTGSNSWIGAPVKIDDISKNGPAQFMSPLEKAQDLYFMFEVWF